MRTLAVVALSLLAIRASAAEPTYAEIRILDSATGRGVPLVELETVHGLQFVSDNAGRIAFREPGLMDLPVYFHVRSHGYAMPKDGFGFAGVTLTPEIGKAVEIKLPRKNIAERLGRLTGEGLYRDSTLLGHPVPAVNNGRVAGQDSVQAAVYRGRIYWFWGDTQRVDYPLGLFRTAGATTPLLEKSDLSHGIPFETFTQNSGFARAMMPLPERPDGVIWIFGIGTVPDGAGRERLFGHYSRRKNLKQEYEQGIALFNDEKALFEPALVLPANETWRRPATHPIPWEDAGAKWLLFGSPTPNVRVPATVKALLDPSKYEAYTCLQAGRNEPDAKPAWRWQSALPPVDSRQEARWLKAKTLKPEDARFSPVNVADPTERVVLHSGTVRWNAYRERWVLIAGQEGGASSYLGEVWYAEARQPTGPFTKAVKIATHDRQSFYNVCHHDFLDRDGGKTIHFEGTYTNDFSGNPQKTPRYNYNQVQYRLDLQAGPLKPARAE